MEDEGVTHNYESGSNKDHYSSNFSAEDLMWFFF